MNPTLPEVVSALCSIGLRPHTMTGFLRQWLINHFSVGTSIQMPEIRTLLFRAVESSELDIESITKWKPSTTGARPAIVIARNEWKVLRQGIDDRMMGGMAGPELAEYYSAFLGGTHTMFCISPKAPEAEILAIEVAMEMLQFGPKIREYLDLKKFVTLGVGKLFELEEAQETYAVPVTVAYTAEEKWKLVPHAPFLKRVVLSAYLP